MEMIDAVHDLAVGAPANHFYIVCRLANASAAYIGEVSTNKRTRENVHVSAETLCSEYEQRRFVHRNTIENMIEHRPANKPHQFKNMYTHVVA